MNTFTLQAPAKLNLSLRVLGKRDDGFHEIDTLMVKLPGLADELEFSQADAFAFKCDDPSVPGDERNLVVKAVRAYESAAGIRCHCAILLKKTIPHGAGLGGGSSDAAMTLLGLNRLNNFKLSVDSMHELAASLGSDIPFFLTTGASRCTGRGEKIEPVPSPPPKPNCSPASAPSSSAPAKSATVAPPKPATSPNAPPSSPPGSSKSLNNAKMPGAERLSPLRTQFAASRQRKS